MSKHSKILKNAVAPKICKPNVRILFLWTGKRICSFLWCHITWNSFLVDIAIKYSWTVFISTFLSKEYITLLRRGGLPNVKKSKNKCHLTIFSTLLNSIKNLFCNFCSQMKWLYGFRYLITKTTKNLLLILERL